MSAKEKDELFSTIAKMDDTQQAKLLEYARQLVESKTFSRDGLLGLAGSISPEDLDLMEKAIEDGCCAAS